MNYIDLINSFWQLDEEYSFNGNETRLYFFLVKKCNTLRWKNPFSNSDGHTASTVGISVNTLKSIRNRLKQAGLIDFKPGGNGARDKCIYVIKVSAVDTLTDTLPDETLTPSLKKTDDISKPKKRIKDKPIKEEEKKVVFNNPFSDGFLLAWAKWKEYKKVQQNFSFKTIITEQAAVDDLKNISDGNEEVAVKIIEKSIAKGWKGLFKLKAEDYATHQQNYKPGSKSAGASKLASSLLSDISTRA